MYLTKPIDRTPVVVQQLSCPESCAPAYYIDISTLGLILGVACLIIFFTQKKLFSHVRLTWKKIIGNLMTWLFLLLAALSVFYTLQITYRPPAQPDCPRGSLLIKANFLPDFFRLPYIWQR